MIKRHDNQNVIDMLIAQQEDVVYRKVVQTLYINKETWIGKRYYKYYDKMISDTICNNLYLLIMKDMIQNDN